MAKEIVGHETVAQSLVMAIRSAGAASVGRLGQAVPWVW